MRSAYPWRNVGRCLGALRDLPGLKAVLWGWCAQPRGLKASLDPTRAVAVAVGNGTAVSVSWASFYGALHIAPTPSRKKKKKVRFKGLAAATRRKLQSQQWLFTQSCREHTPPSPAMQQTAEHIAVQRLFLSSPALPVWRPRAPPRRPPAAWRPAALPPHRLRAT